jgi:hypothetical protein
VEWWTWWVGGGVVLLSFLVLVVALGLLLGRLRAFGLTARALSSLLTDGQKRFQPRILALQREAESLQGKAVTAQEHAMVVQARRGESGNS